MDDARSLLFPGGRVSTPGMVFDFDGTLADSMGVWRRVDEEFLRRRGLDEPEGYVEALSTRNFAGCADWVIERFSLDESPQEIMDEWNLLALEDYQHNVSLKPQVREYLEMVRSLGVRTSIATTLTHDLLEAALVANGAVDLFDALATSDDTARDKHHPDLYLLAARRMGVEADRCSAYEDIVPGALSARGAGMLTIGVRDSSGHQDAEGLRRAAHAFIEDFGELL